MYAPSVSCCVSVLAPAEFKVVTHIPQLTAAEQPTVAVVTLLYCEKLAVDAMMTFKTTYIRIKKKEGMCVFANT